MTDYDFGEVDIVIMAGGGGKRFWPLSRQQMPKQFLRLVDDESMIRHTVKRLLEMVSPGQIWVITNEAYRDHVCEEVPEIPRDNVIAEPMRRDTAAAIMIAAAIVSTKSPERTMVVLPADHVISPQREFVRALAAACRYLRDSSALFVFGIRPDKPSPNFGYLHRGQFLRDVEGLNVSAVERFVEKPSAAKAESYLQAGYFWNSGIFAWKVSSIIDKFAMYLPEHHRSIEVLAKSWGTAEWQRSLQEVFDPLVPISIDYGIMEKADEVVMLEVGFYWNDVGTWDALEGVQTRENEANTILGKHIGIDTNGCIIHSEKQLVATIGVEDLVVVTTEDAVLVMPKKLSSQVKDLVEMLEQQKKQQYL